GRLKREAGADHGPIPALPRSGNGNEPVMALGHTPWEATAVGGAPRRPCPQPEDLPTATPSTPRGDRPKGPRGRTAGIAGCPAGPRRCLPVSRRLPCRAVPEGGTATRAYAPEFHR